MHSSIAWHSQIHRHLLWMAARQERDVPTSRVSRRIVYRDECVSASLDLLKRSAGLHAAEHIRIRTDVLVGVRISRSGMPPGPDYSRDLLCTEKFLARHHSCHGNEQLGESALVYCPARKMHLIHSFLSLAFAVVMTVTAQPPFDPNTDPACTFLVAILKPTV